jgi:perosamine synthetase
MIEQEKDGDVGVLIVHNLGNIINVPRLIRKYPNITFVEDNCEGLFGLYEEQSSGTASLASAISFFGNKNITCGEGGAVITNDSEIYEYVKCLFGQGQSNIRFIHNYLGYNYRMTNIQAAILLGQLELSEEIKEKKAIVFESYRNAIKDREDVCFQSIENGTSPANWMFGVRINNTPFNYEHAENFFNNKKIEIRPMFYPLSNHPYLNNEVFLLHGDEYNAIKLNKECFILPSYPGLNSYELNHIIFTLFEYLNYVKVNS